MASNLAGFALVLSLVAVGVGGYALMQERSTPASELEGRMVAIEDHLARIESTLAERGTPSEREPRLLGRAERVVDADAQAAATPQTPPEESEAARALARAGSEVLQPRAGTLEGDVADVEKMIDAAVAKKAAQMQTMSNKKPSIDVFAKTLELTEPQRKAAEDEVLRAQHRIQEILDIPAEDGTNFMAELVEVMAHGIAEPGKNPGRGMKFFGRILSEKIPGTDETYATRIESVKQGVRDTFKRNWTKKQYGAFQTWQMDPTEVQGIPGSPWKDVETRIINRARQLGAEIPEKGEDD